MRIRFASEVRPDEWPLDPKDPEKIRRLTPKWKPGPRPDILLENEGMLHQVVHVVICKDDGTPMWDQIEHVEHVSGAATLPVDSRGRIGLQLQERPVQRAAMPERKLLGRDPAYDEAFLANLGGMKVMQCPRGMAKKGEKPWETAARETREEQGRVIRRLASCGLIWDNTAFKPVPAYGFIAKIDESVPPANDPDFNEGILKVEWYELRDVLRMATTGKPYPLDDGFTTNLLFHYMARKFGAAIL
jgi:hypothetical protein